MRRQTDEIVERRQPCIPAISRHYLRPGVDPELGGAPPVRQQHRHGIRDVFGTGAGRDRSLVIDAFRRGARSDHRPCHRHRLEHLVLDAARQFERRHHYGGRGEPSPNILDFTGHDHIAALRQRLDRLAGVTADDRETRMCV